jgi:hypothetical protein
MSSLPRKINQRLPQRVQRRFDELVKKREAEILTTKEHEELLRLVNRKEKLNAHRMELLAEMAKLRQVSLRELMKQLDIGKTEPV